MNDTLVETIEYRGYEIEIYQDDDPAMDPITEFDWLGTMVTWHKHYSLGHEQPKYDVDAFRMQLAFDADESIEQRYDYWDSGKGWIWALYHESNDDVDRALEIVGKQMEKIINDAILKYYIILPLYLYDHSGITIKTSPFHCPWDSGQIGFIYVSKEKIKKEYQWKRLNKNRRMKIIDILVSEVKMYDQYLTRDIYGYIANNPFDEEIHSCWGFYGHDWKENGLLESAKAEIDYAVIEEETFKAECDQADIGDIDQLRY